MTSLFYNPTAKLIACPSHPIKTSNIFYNLSISLDSIWRNDKIKRKNLKQISN